MPEVIDMPQEEQMAVAEIGTACIGATAGAISVILAPQLSQNVAPSGCNTLHFGHIDMVVLLILYLVQDNTNLLMNRSSWLDKTPCFSWGWDERLSLQASISFRSAGT